MSKREYIFDIRNSFPSISRMKTQTKKSPTKKASTGVKTSPKKAPVTKKTTPIKKEASSKIHTVSASTSVKT